MCMSSSRDGYLSHINMQEWAVFCRGHLRPGSRTSCRVYRTPPTSPCRGSAPGPAPAPLLSTVAPSTS